MLLEIHLTLFIYYFLWIMQQIKYLTNESCIIWLSFFQNLLDAKQTISQYVTVELKLLLYFTFWL